MVAASDSTQPGPRLGEPFFARATRDVARDLIGCTLLHAGVGGVIVETEAYEEDDPACHAYSGMTARNAALFGPPGRAYVYICYGIHRMFNVVTESDGVPGAVLVRSLQPTQGVPTMMRRRGTPIAETELCSGPGKLCEALAISESQTNEALMDGAIAVHARSGDSSRPSIVAGPRIGITRAVELPWRYCEAESRFLSRPSVQVDG